MRGMRKLWLLLPLFVFIPLSCGKETKSDWDKAKLLWEQVIQLNQDFQGLVFADPKPTLRELYQKAISNIERLNQFRGQTQAMNLPSQWKSDFDQGLQANIQYYKSCQLIIDKRTTTGQAYDELRDAARDCLSFYQQCREKDWPEISRETFQIAAKMERLIVAAKPAEKISPRPEVIVVEKPSPQIGRPFVTARGVGICPESQVRYLTEEDLYGRSSWELDIMRNEIYARHGRRFVKKEYQMYFDSQPWYEVNPNYSDRLLSAIERRNAAFILDYQKRIGAKT